MREDLNETCIFLQFFSFELYLPGGKNFKGRSRVNHFSLYLMILGKSYYLIMIFRLVIFHFWSIVCKFKFL